jgi:hypothetical protein
VEKSRPETLPVAEFVPPWFTGTVPELVNPLLPSVKTGFEAVRPVSVSPAKVGEAAGSRGWPEPAYMGGPAKDIPERMKKAAMIDIILRMVNLLTLLKISSITT